MGTLHADRNPESSWVFLHRSGRNVGEPVQEIKNGFHGALKLADIQNFTWHDLRQTFGLVSDDARRVAAESGRAARPPGGAEILPEGFANDRQVLERFKREAHAASALNHSNICFTDCRQRARICRRILTGPPSEQTFQRQFCGGDPVLWVVTFAAAA